MSVNPVNTSVTVGTSSTSVVNAETREVLVLTNDSDTDIYIAYGEAATLNNWQLLLANGGVISLSATSRNPVDRSLISLSVFAISSSASKNLLIVSK